MYLEKFLVVYVWLIHMSVNKIHVACSEFERVEFKLATLLKIEL